MAFWRRIHCHFCGARSPHAKSSGIPQFQCANCEAWNYLDSHGEVIDPPSSVTARAAVAQNSDRQRQKPDHFSGNEPEHQIFCQTCLHNQHIFSETLSNYLPDEDHPQYAQFERGLPQYKRELEKRYPQICKNCAPRAQAAIHRADYYSMTNNASRLMQGSGESRRSASPTPAKQSRDDAFKIGMRTFLTLLGTAIFASASLQSLWHAYALLGLAHGDFSVESSARGDQTVLQALSQPTLSRCVAAATGLRPTAVCLDHIAAFVPRTLLLSLGLIWYNHGLKDLYHPTVRFVSISGQKQHFWISLVVLVARSLAYFNLSDQATVSRLTSSELVAAHSITLALIFGGRLLAQNGIESHKWRLNGSIMPRPEDRDVLGASAGPAAEQYTPQASGSDPSKLLGRNVNEPFPIHRLASRHDTYDNLWKSPGNPPPSPPGSDAATDDPMDIEPVSPARAYSSGWSVSDPNSMKHAMPLSQRGPFDLQSDQIRGWDSVRTNLFSIEDELRTKHQRTQRERDVMANLRFEPPAQQSPFRGRLPQAPMSMERRLRNPISQVPQFKDIPITQRQDFLQQMRSGIDKGKGFGERVSDSSTAHHEDNESEASFTPAKSRTRGQLELQSSGWNLASDVKNATGLEDIFGSSFRLNEGPEGSSEAATAAREVKSRALASAGAALTVAFALGLGLDVGGMRRAICLYLVQLLETLGY